MTKKLTKKNKDHHQKRVLSVLFLLQTILLRYRYFDLVVSTMSLSVGSKLQLEPGSWAELAYDVLIGTFVGATHSMKIVVRLFYERMILPVLQAFGFQEEKESDLEKTLKVVAVGYGRTGTVSSPLDLVAGDFGFDFSIFAFVACRIQLQKLYTIFLESISLHFYPLPVHCDAGFILL